MGPVFPGILLSALHLGYIAIPCYFKPSVGLALPIDERVTMRWFRDR
jgi:TRAP-type mannitol/chloroaromatic compound transport system permease large subunit